MNFDDVISKLKSIESELKARHPDLVKDKDKATLARAVKLNEEVGELMEEVLLTQGLQRDSKYLGHDATNLQKEFGDVFNTLILLGLSMDIDPKKAIKERVEELYKRIIKG